MQLQQEMVCALNSSLSSSSEAARSPYSHIHRDNEAFDVVPIGTQLRTLGCGTCPVSIGGRRWRAERTEHLAIVSVLVQVKFALGGNIASMNMTRNRCKC